MRFGRIFRISAVLGLAAFMAASAGCDDVEGRIMDTVYLGLRIAGIWV